MIDYSEHINKHVRFTDQQGDIRRGYIRYSIITNDYYIELSNSRKIYIKPNIKIHLPGTDNSQEKIVLVDPIKIPSCKRCGQKKDLTKKRSYLCEDCRANTIF